MGTRIKVSSLVRVLKIDGETLPVGTGEEIEVKSALFSGNQVVIRVNGTDYTIVGYDMEMAIRNALNC